MTLTKKGASLIAGAGGLVAGILLTAVATQYKVVDSVLPAIVTPTVAQQTNMVTAVPTASPSATVVPTQPVSRYYYPTVKPTVSVK